MPQLDPDFLTLLVARRVGKAGHELEQTVAGKCRTKAKEALKERFKIFFIPGVDTFLGIFIQYKSKFLDSRG